MKIRRLFATQIGTHDFTTSSHKALIRLLLKDTHVLAQTDDIGIRWSKKNYRGGYTSYQSMPKLHELFSTFTRLQNLIDREVKKFSKGQHWDLGPKKSKLGLQMTTCWTSIMPEHTYHPLHIHPQSVISGTFYLQVPTRSSALKIEDPRLDLQMSAPPRRHDAPDEFKPYVHLEPKVGRLILFESWLRHEVPPQTAKGDRISVSFNYEWIRS